MAGLADLSDDELLAMQAKAAPGADRDYLIRTVYGEARGEPPEGQKAVASVILNRARQTGKPVRDIVLAPAQFTPWHDAKARDELTSLSEDSPEYRAISDNIASALDGDDPTGGADHFYAPKLADPVWAHGHEGTDIGNHRFLKLGYGEGGQVGGPKDDDLSSMSDADLLAAYKAQQGPQAAPAPTTPADRPKPATPPRKAPVVSMKRPTIAQDVASGFAEPFKALGHGVMEDFRRAKSDLTSGALTTLAEAGRRTVDGLAAPFRLAGDVLGLASAPVMAAVRPTARAINNNIPMQAGKAPELRIDSRGPHLTKGHPMTPDESQTALEGAINGAFSAVSPKKVGVRMPKLPPKSLEELDKAQHAEWKKVDASGYRFSQPDVTSAAADIRQIVNDAGPELYSKSAQVADRIENLAKRGDLSPAQANRLRSQIGEKLLQPGSDEASVGSAIKARIDSLIDTDPSGVLAPAREAYKRYIKYKDVSDRLEDSALNKAGSGSGGNSNAVRQALKPLVKKKGGQRMLTATPDEKAALRDVVVGTPVQNLLRTASAFDPFHSKLGTLLQTGLGFKTGGLSAATIPLGMAATAGERAMSARNVQKLLDLISTGGVVPKVQPGVPAAVSRLLSPAGLAGVGVTTAPLARIPSLPVTERTKRKTAAAAR